MNNIIETRKRRSLRSIIFKLALLIFILYPIIHRRNYAKMNNINDDDDDDDYDDFYDDDFDYSTSSEGEFWGDDYEE